MKLPVSNHLNIKQLDFDISHSTNTWMMAFMSLRFIVHILLTFANILRCMVSQLIQYSPSGTVLAFVWKKNGLICSKMSFRIYTVTIRCLPMHNRDVDVFSVAMTMTWTIIWDGKLALSVIHFNVIVIMRIGLAAVMTTIFGATLILCLIHVSGRPIRLRLILIC